MKMEVSEARPWAEYDAEGKVLLAQFGHHDLIGEGDEEPTDAEDYVLARMAANAPAMHQLLVSVSLGDDSNAIKARDLLKEIDDV